MGWWNDNKRGRSAGAEDRGRYNNRNFESHQRGSSEPFPWQKLRAFEEKEDNETRKKEWNELGSTLATTIGETFGLKKKGKANDKDKDKNSKDDKKKVKKKLKKERNRMKRDIRKAAKKQGITLPASPGSSSKSSSDSSSSSRSTSAKNRKKQRSYLSKGVLKCLNLYKDKFSSPRPQKTSPAAGRATANTNPAASNSNTSSNTKSFLEDKVNSLTEVVGSLAAKLNGASADSRTASGARAAEKKLRAENGGDGDFTLGIVLQALAPSMGFPRSLIRDPYKKFSDHDAATMTASHCNVAKVRTALQARGLENTGNMKAKVIRLLTFEREHVQSDADDDAEHEDEEDDDEDEDGAAKLTMKRTHGAAMKATPCAMKKPRA